MKTILKVYPTKASANKGWLKLNARWPNVNNRKNVSVFVGDAEFLFSSITDSAWCDIKGYRIDEIRCKTLIPSIIWEQVLIPSMMHLVHGEK